MAEMTEYYVRIRRLTRIDTGEHLVSIDVNGRWNTAVIRGFSKEHADQLYDTLLFCADVTDGGRWIVKGENYLYIRPEERDAP